MQHNQSQFSWLEGFTWNFYLGTIQKEIWVTNKTYMDVPEQSPHQDHSACVKRALQYRSKVCRGLSPTTCSWIRN